MIFSFYFIFLFSQTIVSSKIHLSRNESPVNDRGKSWPFFAPSRQIASSPVPGEDPTAVAIQGVTATNSFENSAILQGSNIWPPYSRFDVLPSPDNPLDVEDERMGLLFDGNGGGEGGIDISIPSIPLNPIQIFNGVPEYIDNLRQWFQKPEEPNCRDRKYAFCCQKPAPKPKRRLDTGRSTSGRPPIGEPEEYSQRRAACTTCRCSFALFSPSSSFKSLTLTHCYIVMKMPPKNIIQEAHQVFRECK